jgi:hypothetical protein
MRNAEINQNGPRMGIDQHVARFHITVDDAGRMGGVERIRHLSHDRHRRRR